MMFIRAVVMTCLVGLAAILAGCQIDRPINPSFPLTLEAAESAIVEMEGRPVGLTRPVVILGGYFDPGFGTKDIEDSIKRVTGDDRIISVSFFARFNFEGCRDHAIRSIEAAFPSDDPDWTAEVDVIAGSMGGIVARYANLPLSDDELHAVSTASPHRKRLKIARLFTISTPHRGANMAALPTFDSLVLGQRAGSQLLHSLDDALASARYEIVPYVRLGDRVVGVSNAAPPGRLAWWVPNAPLQFSHINSMRDERIIADIARRLRGETPYTIAPPAPLPPESGAGDN